MLTDSDARARLAAAQALWRTRDSEQIEAFCSVALNDTSRHVRAAAVEALGMIGDARAMHLRKPPDRTSALIQRNG